MIDRLMRDLHRFALARVDLKDRSVQIHRLLQALVREQPARRRTRSGSCAPSARSWRSCGPTDEGPDDPTTWADYSVIWPHLYACESDKAGADESESRQLMVDRLRYLAVRGQITSALELAERLWDWGESSPPEDIWRLAVGFELANLLRPRGDVTRALELDEEVHERQLRPSLDRARPPPHVADRRQHRRATCVTWGAGPRRSTTTGPPMTPLSREYGPDHPSDPAGGQQPGRVPPPHGQCFDARDLDLTAHAPAAGDPRPRAQRHADRRPRTSAGTCATAASSTTPGGSCSATLELCRDTFGEDSPLTLRATLGLAVAERRAGRHTRGPGALPPCLRGSSSRSSGPSRPRRCSAR